MTLLFVLSLTIPVIMMITGILFRLRTAQNMDSRWGYRTLSARRSRLTWDFAQKYAGKLWIIAGAALFVLSAIVFQLMDMPKGNLMVDLVIIQLGIWIVTTGPVERALTHRFDETGQPVKPDDKGRKS